MAACRDSGRTPVIAAASPAQVSDYLTRQGLAELIRNVYTLNGDSPEHGWVNADLLRSTTTALDASTSDCAIITATAATIKDASDAVLATIGYAAMPGTDEQLTAAGADSLLPSLADLTLRLRARPFRIKPYWIKAGPAPAPRLCRTGPPGRTPGRTAHDT